MSPPKCCAATRSHRRGSAILPALIVVVMVATLSTIFVQVSLSKNKEQRQSVDSKRAFYMAEAGLAEGFMALRLGKSGNVAGPELPARFGNGLFWTVATDIGSGRVELEATGLCGAGRARLAMTVEKTSATVASLGFFGEQSITVDAGGLIDSYDSRDGPYTGQALLAPLGSLLSVGSRVGSNADITVNGGTLLSPTKIYGEVTPGPLGTVFRDRNALITGAMVPRDATAQLPEVTVPALALVREIDVADRSQSQTIPTGVHGIKKLSVGSGGIVTLVGPASVVFEEMKIMGGATLRLDARSGPIKLYVTKAMEFERSSQLTTLSTDPLAVSVQLAGAATALLGATGDFYGSIYAPDADVVLPSSFTVFGSVAAKTLAIAANGKLHFDRAFTAGTSADLGGTPSLLGWHIVELPNVPVVSLRFDALANLLREGKIPLEPADSHLDVGETLDTLLRGRTP